MSYYCAPLTNWILYDAKYWPSRLLHPVALSADSGNIWRTAQPRKNLFAKQIYWINFASLRLFQYNVSSISIWLKTECNLRKNCKIQKVFFFLNLGIDSILTCSRKNVLLQHFHFKRAKFLFFIWWRQTLLLVYRQTVDFPHKYIHKRLSVCI